LIYTTYTCSLLLYVQYTYRKNNVWGKNPAKPTCIHAPADRQNIDMYILRVNVIASISV